MGTSILVSAVNALELFNAVAPAIAVLIKEIRDADPNETVGEVLERADTKFNENIARAESFADKLEEEIASQSGESEPETPEPEPE